MRGDARGEDALAHVLHVRQAEMLGRRNVAEKIRARGRGDRAAYGPGDVVVSGRTIGHQRTENVEGCLPAELLL